MTKRLPKGIRLRGTKYFVDVTVDGKRKTATCDTLAEAVARQETLKEALLNGVEINATRANSRVWTLAEALENTLGLAAPEGWRGASYAKVAKMNVESAIQFMGSERKLDTIDHKLINDWLNHCETEDRNSNATINRKLSAVSKVLKVAKDHGGLPELPRIPKLRTERVGRIRFLTKDEECQLLEYFRVTGRDEVEDFVATLIDTGMRRGELMELRPSDIDMKTGVIMVYGKEGKGTKNGRIRSVPMTDRVRRILGKRLTNRVKCFTLKTSEIRHAWDSARSHMGMAEDKDFVLHICRHTCASRLVKAGVSLPVVRDWLGHSNIQTTLRYAHLFPQDLMLAAKALERIAAE